MGKTERSEGVVGGFQLIPAVDVLGEQAVRLEQGRFEDVLLRAGDPFELARRFAHSNPALIHLVDLEASRRGGVRPEFVRSMVETVTPVPLQVAGGVRCLDDALALIRAGAARVVVGTAAFSHPSALPSYVELLGERLVVAVDVRNGIVAAAGWERSTGIPVDEAVDRCTASGVGRIICTAIERDGTMLGPDLELLARVRARSPMNVLAAGGIRSHDDLDRLAELGLEGAVVGRALLEGALALGR